MSVVYKSHALKLYSSQKDIGIHLYLIKNSPISIRAVLQGKALIPRDAHGTVPAPENTWRFPIFSLSKDVVCSFCQIGPFLNIFPAAFHKGVDDFRVGIGFGDQQGKRPGRGRLLQPPIGVRMSTTWLYVSVATPVLRKIRCEKHSLTKVPYFSVEPSCNSPTNL